MRWINVDLGWRDVGNDGGLRSVYQHVAQVVEQFLGAILGWLQVEQLRVLQKRNIKNVRTSFRHGFGSN
jgi:hypothetical protein